MIWAILVVVGVPLWLCAIGILVVARRSRRLRSRNDNIPVRVLRPEGTRGRRGNGIWVSDVFAWRGRPAAWEDDLFHAVGGHDRDAAPAELRALRRLGADCAVVEFSGPDGETLTVAAVGTLRQSLLGPFATTTAPAVGSLSPSGAPPERGSTP